MRVLERLTIGVLALATASCASAPTQAPTVNVTGNWVGAWTCDNVFDGNGIVVLKLVQSGGNVTGDVNVTGLGVNRSGAGREAIVSGDELVLNRSPELTGSFKVTGDRMAGPFVGACAGKVDLAREPFRGTGTTARLSSVSMTVEALDVASRWITLRTPSGATMTMQVDERVRNLPQVSVGDIVTVAYYESWALSLDRPGDPAGAIVGRAAPGEVPAGFVAQRSTIQATVTSIDAGKPSVTFRGPKGVQEVNVAQDPRILARLKVGETYNVTYTEALVVAVEKSTKR